MLFLSDPQQFIITSLFLIPGLLLGLVLHEYAHARVAVARGDETPRLDGRLSLDPSHHLDPLGTIAVFLIHFGWAKPVRINPARMRHRLDPALVSLAGPLTNLVIAVALSIPLKLLLAGPPPVIFRLLLMAFYLNVVLGTFNILPIPPLDGYSLVSTLLRRRFPRFFYQVDAYSSLILIGLVVLLFYSGGRLFLSVYAVFSGWLLGTAYYPF
jgi:Zn-dependent protease